MSRWHWGTSCSDMYRCKVSTHPVVLWKVPCRLVVDPAGLGRRCYDVDLWRNTCFSGLATYSVGDEPSERSKSFPSSLPRDKQTMNLRTGLIAPRICCWASLHLGFVTSLKTPLLSQVRDVCTNRGPSVDLAASETEEKISHDAQPACSSAPRRDGRAAEGFVGTPPAPTGFNFVGAHPPPPPPGLAKLRKRSVEASTLFPPFWRRIYLRCVL